MMPPPKHKPINRPCVNCVDVFSPDMRKCVDGVWFESPLAILCEVQQCLLHHPSSVRGLLPLIERTIRQCNPALLAELGKILPTDYELPSGVSTHTP